jgi:branched-chain amino acid transport system ATP-binding protein
MTQTSLEVDGLRGGYNDTVIIRDLSMRVADGEVLAIIGRNGAGKTTTLATIAGILPRMAGTVKIGGVPFKSTTARGTREALGIVLEGRSVFPSLSVRQNLTVGRADPDEVFASFPELSRRADVKAGSLSGGEQQLLALARAMARRPHVLLIDELSFGLAPAICDRLFAAIRDFAGQGRAVVVVEQHLRYAEMVGSRVLVMHQGRFALELSGDELQERAGEIERLYLGGPET